MDVVLPLLQDFISDGHLEDMCRVYAQRERELAFEKNLVSEIISSDRLDLTEEEVKEGDEYAEE